MLYQIIYDNSFGKDVKASLKEMLIEARESGLTCKAYLFGVFENADTRKDDTSDKFISRIKYQLNYYGLTYSGKAVKGIEKKAAKKTTVYSRTFNALQDDTFTVKQIASMKTRLSEITAKK